MKIVSILIVAALSLVASKRLHTKDAAKDFHTAIGGDKGKDCKAVTEAAIAYIKAANLCTPADKQVITAVCTADASVPALVEECAKKGKSAADSSEVAKCLFEKKLLTKDAATVCATLVPATR